MMNKNHLTLDSCTAASSLPSPRALIVEDELLVAKGIARVLRGCGFKTDAVGSVREAIEYFVKNDPPHLLTLDLGLPSGPGQLLLEALGSIGALNETVIAVVSAAHDSEMEKALAAGADLCLRKPFHLKEFEAIQSALAAKAYYGRRS